MRILGSWRSELRGPALDLPRSFTGRLRMICFFMAFFLGWGGMGNRCFIPTTDGAAHNRHAFEKIFPSKMESAAADRATLFVGICQASMNAAAASENGVILAP